MATANIHIPVTTNADGTVRAVGTQLDGLARKAEQTGEKMGRAFNKAAQTQKTVIEEGIGRWQKAMGMGAAVWGAVSGIQRGIDSARSSAQTRANEEIDAVKMQQKGDLGRRRREAEAVWTGKDNTRKYELDSMSVAARQDSTAAVLRLAGLSGKQAAPLLMAAGGSASAHAELQAQAEQLGRTGMDPARLASVLETLAAALGKFGGVDGYGERLRELSGSEKLRGRKDIGDLAMASLVKGRRMSSDEERKMVQDLIAGIGVGSLEGMIPKGKFGDITGYMQFEKDGKLILDQEMKYRRENPWAVFQDITKRAGERETAPGLYALEAQKDAAARAAEMAKFDAEGRKISGQTKKGEPTTLETVGAIFSENIATTLGLGTMVANLMLTARAMKGGIPGIPGVPGAPTPANGTGGRMGPLLAGIGPTAAIALPAAIMIGGNYYVMVSEAENERATGNIQKLPTASLAGGAAPSGYATDRAMDRILDELIPALGAIEKNTAEMAKRGPAVTP
jgi:hypothetical protein